MDDCCRAMVAREMREQAYFLDELADQDHTRSELIAGLRYAAEYLRTDAEGIEW